MAQMRLSGALLIRAVHARLRLLKAWEAGAIMQTMSLLPTIFAILLPREPLTLLQVMGGLGLILGGIGVGWGPRQAAYEMLQ